MSGASDSMTATSAATASSVSFMYCANDGLLSMGNKHTPAQWSALWANGRYRLSQQEWHISSGR